MSGAVDEADRLEYLDCDAPLISFNHAFAAGLDWRLGVVARREGGEQYELLQAVIPDFESLQIAVSDGDCLVGQKVADLDPHHIL